MGETLVPNEMQRANFGDANFEWLDFLVSTWTALNGRNALISIRSHLPRRWRG
jgi:hypothetical protein